MANKEVNLIVEDVQQLSVFKSFTTNQKLFLSKP